MPQLKARAVIEEGSAVLQGRADRDTRSQSDWVAAVPLGYWSNDAEAVNPDDLFSL